MVRRASRDATKYIGATRVSVRLASVQDSFGSSTSRNMCRFAGSMLLCTITTFLVPLPFSSPGVFFFFYDPQKTRGKKCPSPSTLGVNPGTPAKCFLEDERHAIPLSSSRGWQSEVYSCVYLLFPAHDHEPAPTLRDSLNPHICLNAGTFQSSPMPDAWMSLCTQSVHSLSFPPRARHTTPSRFLIMIGVSNRPPLIRMSAPTLKSLLVFLIG